ncbi:MAG: tetratricopeptide repeat protein [Candidatus Zixiibacteriota bacterium]|nr:MAG: tetratricopeptide repeat protein [candidate division Zixibacteria bacterium]
MRKLDSKYVWAIAIFATALALRIIYFLQVRSNYPGWDTPTIDPLYHDLWAKQIASGNILGTGPFFRAPLYAYFLGAIYAIFGPSLTAAKIVQHIIGAFSCSLIFLFSDRYFNRKTAIISGLISAFYWVFIYFEDELLLDSLLILLAVILIWLLVRAFEKPDLKRFLLSGIILGLAAITRPNFLVMLPVAAIWVFYAFKLDIKEKIVRLLVLTAGCAVIISPVTIRNILVGDDMVLIASQGGINFYIGNNEYATGSTAVMPEFGPTWQYADCEYLAKLETGKIGKEMKQSEVSAFYYKKALEFILNKPAEWIYLMTKKLSYFWNSYEISNNQNLYFFRKFASVTVILPPLLFIIAPLSLIGLWYIFSKDAKYHIIGLFIIAYMLTVIGFFVNGRFRLPVLPFLIILSVYTVFRTVDYFRAKKIKKLIYTIIALAILMPLCNIDLFNITHSSFAMSHFSLGNVYLKKGLKQKALDEYARALELEKCVPSAHLNSGIIYFGENDFAEARREFVLELSSCYRSAQAHNNLSVLDRLSGEFQSALAHAEEAISQSPQYLEAYINKILALRRLGENQEAFNTAKNLTVNFPDYLPGHYFLGKFLNEQGNIIEASNEFRFIIGRGEQNIIERYDLSTIYSSQTEYGYKPHRMPGMAYYELGNIFVSRGEIDSALTYFRRATEILAEYPDAWTNLALAYDHKKMYGDALSAFKRSLDLNPENPFTLYNLGLTLGKLGLFQEAVEVFRIAIDIKPDFPEAIEKLRITESILESSGN